MRRHPREMIVEYAKAEIKMFILGRLGKKFTYGEFIRILTSVFSDLLQDAAKQMIQKERHPNDHDCPGGIESELDQ